MKKQLLLLAFICTTVICQAQKENYFQDAIDLFSKKKTSYITLNDGTTIEGTIKKLNWKKGLFEEIKLETNGSKSKISAEEIKHMYLPQGNLDKIGNALVMTTDATKWNTKSEINMDHIKDGYAYFESAEVQIKKKKTQVLLLQLVNPAFAHKIKVYHDPYAKETAGLGIAGLKVTGGDDKSYWVKKGDDVAYKLQKKTYNDEKENLFGDCSDIMKKMEEEKAWKFFPKYVYEYSIGCN